MKRFPGVRDWVNEKNAHAGDSPLNKYEYKEVRLERLEPIPKMNIYKVQPRDCYLPTYENYIYNDNGDMIYRTYKIEEETLLEEIDISNMTMA